MYTMTCITSIINVLEIIDFIIYYKLNYNYIIIIINLKNVIFKYDYSFTIINHSVHFIAKI